MAANVQTTNQKVVDEMEHVYKQMGLHNWMDMSYMDEAKMVKLLKLVVACFGNKYNWTYMNQDLKRAQQIVIGISYLPILLANMIHDPDIGLEEVVQSIPAAVATQLD